MSGERRITIDLSFLENIDLSLAPLLVTQGGEVWDAYLTLDEDGVYNFEMASPRDNTTRAANLHGRTQCWTLPGLVKRGELSELLNDANTIALLQRVHDGRELVWTGSSWVCKLNVDAQEASDQLDRLFAELDGCCWQLCSADEYIERYELSDLWPADTSLFRAARRIRCLALSDGLFTGTQDVMEEAFLRKLHLLAKAGDDSTPTVEQAAALNAQ
jgi:hypothetical protein